MGIFESDGSGDVRRWSVLRPSPGHVTECMLLSGEFFSVTTHWVGHCTLCSRLDDCALCVSQPARGLYYLPVAMQSSVWLLELSTASSALFEQSCKLLYQRITPGMIVRLKRTGKRAPVHSEVMEVKDTARLITRFETCRRVMTIFKFPPPQPHESYEQYELRIQLLANTRNKSIARQIDAGTYASPRGHRFAY